MWEGPQCPDQIVKQSGRKGPSHIWRSWCSPLLWSINFAAREGKAPQRSSLSALISLLLALEDADHLSRGRTILHSHRRSPRERARCDQRGALDSALGREPHFGYGGIAAGLGDLAATQLG